MYLPKVCIFNVFPGIEINKLNKNEQMNLINYYQEQNIRRIVEDFCLTHEKALLTSRYSRSEIVPGSQREYKGVCL